METMYDAVTLMDLFFFFGVVYQILPYVCRNTLYAAAAPHGSEKCRCQAPQMLSSTICEVDFDK